VSRCVVNVATGRYLSGQRRLAVNLPYDKMFWSTHFPPGSPEHRETPYAFKAWALEAARLAGHETLLWADASIVPIRDLEPLWARIEHDGYWISHNGWKNAEWTADSAYEDLPVTREFNWTIPHVVAGTFGIDLRHKIGRQIFDEYFRLAQTKAFCGPWFNTNHPNHAHMAIDGFKAGPCGDERVIGHRQDQTALSAIAAIYGCKLTDAPDIFAYSGRCSEDTILMAAGV
jgi:hypothetical protein